MERRVLNSPREGAPPSSATPAAELASRLQRAMLRLKGEHMAEDGRGVAYAALPSSPLFAEYVELAQELSGCDPAPLSLDARKAFFISILLATPSRWPRPLFPVVLHCRSGIGNGSIDLHGHAFHTTRNIPYMQNYGRTGQAIDELV